MSKAPDPADNFGGGANHRAGYGGLEGAMYWALKGGTLMAGEGEMIAKEVLRLREENRQLLLVHEARLR